MSKLSEIMAAFLNDLNYAQNESNKESARLAVLYEKGALLEFFPVPNGLLNEAVLTLRFQSDGIKEIPVSDGRRDTKPSGDFVNEVATVIAEAVGTTAGNRLDVMPSHSEVARLAAAIRSERGISRLAPFFAPAVRKHLNSLHLSDPSELDVSLSRITTACSDAFLSDADLTGAVGDARDFAQTCCSDLRATIVGALSEAASHLRKIRDDPSSRSDIGVLLDPVIPDGALHTLVIKATLRDYKWVVQDSANEQMLVPTV